MRKSFFGVLLIALIALSGCGKVNDISIKGIDGVKLKGIKQNVVLLNLDVEVDNPNTRKISITHIEFKAWLRDRELGKLRVNEHIKLEPCSKKKYTVPVEIELRTMADAFKLFSGSIDDLLDSIEVEGFIKGKSFPVRKKLVVNRQPFRNLATSL